MNFQVTVLKVLVSYPDGFAVMDDIKRDMAILATSGRDWADRTKRLAARVPDLDIFSQGLVYRESGGWKIKVGPCSNSWRRAPHSINRSRRLSPRRSMHPYPVCRRSRSGRSVAVSDVSAAVKDASGLDRTHPKGASASEATGRTSRLKRSRWTRRMRPNRPMRSISELQSHEAGVGAQRPHRLASPQP
ncbi:hypothetical protein ABIF62_008528 [Bradyrhizobium japonicum]